MILNEFVMQFFSFFILFLTKENNKNKICL